MNKQIEEIKNVLIRTCKRIRTKEEDFIQDRYAEALYTAGYRKQSEVAREIFAELKTVMMDEYRYPIIAELKKKYIGEQE